MLRAAHRAEACGIPSVSIVTSAFKGLALNVAKGLGMSATAIAEYPGVAHTDAPDVFREKVANVLAQRIVAGLAAAPERVARAAEPADRQVVFDGTLDAVHEHFQRHGWSDGLPFMPPTLARVAQFLGFTQRAADEVLGVLPPERRQATVWNVAVNGAMAGCRPEYLPVLLAVAEALCDPEFHLEHGGATPGWEPLVVVGGPIAAQLGFNSAEGVLRAGRQANTSVGRFVRLFIRNIAGQRIAPGSGDKATLGLMFNAALCEDEQAVRGFGWPSFGNEQGVADGASYVALRSVIGISTPVWGDGTTAAPHLRDITDSAERHLADGVCRGVYFGRFHQLLVISPALAEVLARDGIGKPELREHLYRNARVKAERVDGHFRRYGPDVSIKALVAKGLMPARYLESEDPERLVPVFPDKAGIGIVVAGDRGRVQSRWYAGLGAMGAPVTKKVADRSQG